MIKDVLDILDQSIAKYICVRDCKTNVNYAYSSNLEDIYKAVPSDSVINKITMNKRDEWIVYIESKPTKVIRSELDNMQTTANVYSSDTRQVIDIIIAIDDITFSFDIDYDKNVVRGDCRVLGYRDSEHHFKKPLYAMGNVSENNLNSIYRMLSLKQVEKLDEFIETVKQYVREDIIARYVKDEGSIAVEAALTGLLDIPHFKGLTGLEAWTSTMTDVLDDAYKVLHHKDPILIVRPDIDVSCACVVGIDKAFILDIDNFITPYVNSKYEIKSIVFKFLEQHPYAKYNAYVNIFAYAMILIKKSYECHEERGASNDNRQNREEIMDAIDNAL